MKKPERQHAIELNAELRQKCFDEVTQTFTVEQAEIEASRCLNCKNAPCVSGCPVGVKIPDFISAIKSGNYIKAGEIINQTNNLPSICGRVCPQELQCEAKCVMGNVNKPVAIGNLERFIGDYALNGSKKSSIETKQTSIEAKLANKKVAVVGSGPSSLTIAGTLAKKGVRVTVFEAFHKAGGVLVYGIPEFRLPKKLVQAEIDKLVDLGVEICLNTVVGRTITMPELIENYDAIFLGTGAGLPMFLNIKGEGLNGVFSANEYLTRVNLMRAYEPESKTPVMRGKKVIVVGAGNVAMDSARTARRLGGEVTIVYRRSKTEMPARKEEIIHAEQEGINFELLTNPVEILGENSFVKSVKCERMTLGEPDERGRRKPIRLENSEFEIECDMVIIAVGTSPNPLLTNSFDELKTNSRGTLVVDDKLQTTVENIYAGGDVVTGSATVIKAMGAGKEVAENLIKKWLSE